MPNKPKVLIGVPCGEFMRSRTAMAIMRLLAVSRVSVGVQPGYAGDVAQNQNMLAQCAIDVGAEYLCLIETDMVFPADALMRLLAHEQDIVGVLYRFREPPHDVMLWPTDKPVPAELIVTAAAPSGLMLIHTRVLKALQCPWFFKTYTDHPNHTISADRNFCDQATAAGFHVFADGALSAEVQHIGSSSIPLNLSQSL